MKRKEIANHLDRVGLVITNTEIIKGKATGKSRDFTAGEFEALKAGLAAGLAYGSLLLEGLTEPDKLYKDAAKLFAAALEYLEEGNDND